MKITDIRFGMLRVPLKTPFKTALRTVDKVEDIVVMVHTDDGRVGYGEAPATAVITGDTHGSIVDAIRHYIAPRLIGQDIADLNRITKLVQGSMEKNTSAKAAVEIAVYDLWGQLYDAPLYKLLGGGDPVITTDITISVDYIDKMVADRWWPIRWRPWSAVSSRSRSRWARTSAWTSSAYAPSTPRWKIAPCSAWTPTRAGRPRKPSTRCMRWKTRASAWNWWSSR